MSYRHKQFIGAGMTGLIVVFLIVLAVA